VVGLPGRLRETPQSLSEVIQPLTKSLTDGDAAACQRIAFSFFLNGRTSAQICDELITPALALIGERWSHGDVEIFEEHRAVQMVSRLLHEFRVAIGPPAEDAPIAIGGTAEGDHYGLPTAMIELALIEAGWRATSLGSSLPFATLQSAIRKNRPQLFWLSLSTAIEDPFAKELNEFGDEASQLASVFVGGRALTQELRKGLRCVTPCDNIQQLVAHAQAIASRQ
jgi:methanogenic corrinoid protein MtbC1